MSEKNTSQDHDPQPQDPAGADFDEPQRQPEPSGGPRRHSHLFTIIALILLFALLLSTSMPRENAKELSWGTFLAELNADNIIEVNVVGLTLKGKMYERVPGDLNRKPGSTAAGTKPMPTEPERKTVSFTTEVPFTALNNQFLDGLLYTKLRHNYRASRPADMNDILSIITVVVSIIFIAAIIFFTVTMFRRMRDPMGGGGFFTGFGRSPARRYDSNDTVKPITFDDVAGLDNVKKELVEIVDFLKDPKKYLDMGARVPKGTLLVGPPGTGKTLLGRAVAGEAGVPFFSINGSEFIQMFAGVGASRVRDLFRTAKDASPAILFIDEIDAVGRHRGTGIGAGHDEREQTLNQILSEMDGFTPAESVMVMAATNRPDVLDPALLRPGRFDRHITVDRPTLKGREAIFRVHIRGVPLSLDVDIKTLAKRTVGFTGADIRHLVNEATLWATRNGKTVVEPSDFEYAQDKVVMGLRREEVISPEERKKVACHEAGHAIVGWFQPLQSQVHKVSIVPRGRSLGATYMMPESDPIGLTAKQAFSQLAFAMGGRAAERLVFDELPAGVENDLKQATKLARKMVSSWGMSEKIGPMSFNIEETHPFLGREMATNREFSEEMARLIDEETARFLREADDHATKILIDKRKLLDLLTTALENEEELEENRLIEILGPYPFKNIRIEKDDE